MIKNPKDLRQSLLLKRNKKVNDNAAKTNQSINEGGENEQEEKENLIDAEEIQDQNIFDGLIGRIDQEDIDFDNSEDILNHYKNLSEPQPIKGLVLHPNSFGLCLLEDKDVEDKEIKILVQKNNGLYIVR